MALLGLANSAVGAIGAVGDVLGIGGTSDADKRRMAEADQLFNRALQGDRAAEFKLRCLSGDQSARAEACRLGFTDACNAPDGGCGYATTKARSYAQQKVGELDARRLIASGAAAATGAAAQAGTRADPGTYVAATAGHIAGALPSWFWPAVAIAGGGLAWLIFRKK